MCCVSGGGQKLCVGVWSRVSLCSCVCIRESKNSAWIGIIRQYPSAANTNLSLAAAAEQYEWDRKAVSALAQTWPHTPSSRPRCIFMPHSDGFMPAYMSSAYQNLYPTHKLFIQASPIITAEWSATSRGLFHSTVWFCPRATWFNWPRHPSELISKGSCHSLNCEREGALKREDEQRRRWGSAGPWECKHRSRTSRVGIHYYTSTQLFFPPSLWKTGVKLICSKKYVKKKTFTSIYATFILHTLGTLYHRFVLIFDFTHARLWLPSNCVYPPPRNCLIRLLLISRHAVWRA